MNFSEPKMIFMYYFAYLRYTYVMHYISFEYLVNWARITNKCKILILAKVRQFVILSSMGYLCNDIGYITKFNYSNIQKTLYNIQTIR